jgi:uncharacterized membrane protein YqjE
MAAEPASDRSIAALLSDIVGNLQQMVRAEVRLAKVEVRQEVARARSGIVLLAAGGVVVLIALGVLALAAVYGLSLVWPRWAAALTVAAAIAAIGGAVVASGLSRLRSVQWPPPRSAEVLEENIQWVKHRVK